MKKASMLLSAILATALFAGPVLAFDLKKVDIHGFVSQGYIDTSGNNFIMDSKDGSFEFNEVGINFSSQLTDKLRLGIQLFSRDFGDVGDNEINIDWAFADYRFKDYLGVRFGLLKAPHGLYNETRDLDMVRNPIFLPQSIYPEILREVTLGLQGIGVYGYINLNQIGSFSYQAMYGTQDIDTNDRTAGGLSGFAFTGLETENIEADSKIAAALMWETPLPGLQLSVTYNKVDLIINQVFVLPPPTGNIPFVFEIDNLENWVYSIAYTWKNLTLVAEYMRTDMDQNLDAGVFGRFSDSWNPYGWYAGATYRFTEWLELGGYYSEYKSKKPDMGLPDYFDYSKDVALTVRFDINAYWNLKLEAHNVEGAYGLSPLDNPSPTGGINDNYEKYWQLYAVKTTVAF
jgi:hypothetical protein